MVLSEIDPPRKSYILIRGDFKRPAAQVNPGTPAILPPLEQPESGTPSRLHLGVCPRNTILLDG
jgi:hypothetical protein